MTKKRAREAGDGWEQPPGVKREVRVVSAQKVAVESVQWLWEPYVPLKAVSLIAGQQGLGKSTLLAQLAALLSRGKLEGDLEGTPTRVLMATAEDSLQATVVPRLAAAKADRRQIDFISAEWAGLPDLLSLQQDLSQLAEIVQERQARVLMVDPLVSFLDGIDAHKDQQVRQILAPLAAMADDLNLAVVGVMHLNKRDSQDLLTRVSGSIGFTAAARSVLALGRDRHDEERLHLVHAKCNVGPKGPSLACRTVGHALRRKDGEIIRTSRFVIEGESDAKAEDLVAVASSSDEKSERQEAIAFLRSELAGGREVPSVELQQRALKELGVSVATYNRARRALGVVARQHREGDKPHWVASLPEPKGSK